MNTIQRPVASEFASRARIQHPTEMRQRDSTFGHRAALMLVRMVSAVSAIRMSRRRRRCNFCVENRRTHRNAAAGRWSNLMLHHFGGRRSSFVSLLVAMRRLMLRRLRLMFRLRLLLLLMRMQMVRRQTVRLLVAAAQTAGDDELVVLVDQIGDDGLLDLEPVVGLFAGEAHLV